MGNDRGKMGETVGLREMDTNVYYGLSVVSRVFLYFATKYKDKL